MGLRCSLIGHDFGEVEVDRDREERGSEVVVTITEFERCRRCGTTTVISENTEVTTAEPPSDDRGGSADEEDEAEPEHVASSTGNSIDTAHSVDDGVILEDEPDETPERGRGEWPAAPGGDDDGATEEAGEAPDWPTVEGDDEGFAAVPAGGESGDGDAVVESRPDDTASEGRERGQWIEATSEAGSVGAGRSDPSESAEFVRAGDAPAPTDPTVEREGPTEIYCPNCGSTELGKRHSLRAGDICPECRTGYVAEREL